MLGYHLEQAARYRRELGRPDPELEAARRGSGSARPARRRASEAMPTPPRTCSSAHSRCSRRRPRRAPLLIELIGTLEGAATARGSIPADGRAGGRARIRPLGCTGGSHGSSCDCSRTRRRSSSEAEHVTAEALALFGEIGDDLGLAHTYYLVAWINWLQSRAQPTQMAYDEVLRHARKANSRTLVGRAMIQQMGPLYYGPFTIDEIRMRLAALEADGSVNGRIAASSIEADLAQRDGRYSDSLSLLAEVGDLHAELGSDLGTLITMQRRADILAEAGRLDEAADAFREAISQLVTLGMTSFRSTTMISFGDVLYRLGEIDEAERHAIEGEELGAAEDVINFAWGRALRARIAADRGDFASRRGTRSQRARKRVQDRLPDRPRERARGSGPCARRRPAAQPKRRPSCNAQSSSGSGTGSAHRPSAPARYW